ncbi:MAG: BlaI/MecI/CopY family transcriptional regulator [Phycisphaerae bacterium]|nr:BlaI/MecI/CopY family transcriptional regulator [Phycisphaerae bacterium]
MASEPEITLSRRERQIMDIVYRRGRASAVEIRADLPNRPSDSAVRALLKILEDKGHLHREKAEGRNVYSPTRTRNQASRSALRRLLKTFFDGSTTQAVAALLNDQETSPSDEELNRIAEMIERAKTKGDAK